MLCLITIMTTNCNTQKKPLLGMTIDELRALAAENGLPKFAASQIAKWLYEKRVLLIDEMTNLSKSSRERLSQTYCVGRKSPTGETRSSDGTAKYLFEVAGGKIIESVFIPDNDRNNNRATLCISSQAGCKMGCTFCMTGRQGFHGNLTANEIINQIFSVPESGQLTNIVYMGMGEPTDNLAEVMKTIHILTEPWGLAWSPKRITVSSVGNIEGMKRIVEQTGVHIALSIHTPFHDERLRLMPVEKAYPVKKVVDMLRDYDFAHQRRLSIEYIMWSGLNDDNRHAEALCQLLHGTKARVNLIRFHAIPGVNLKTSDESRMIAFREYLNAKGILCTIRRSRGEDIMAACGMLAGKRLAGEETQNKH